MTRSTLGATNRLEVVKPVVHIAEFLSLAFPGGTIRLTNASRNIVWGGNTWLGNGVLLEPGMVPESSDGKARRAELVLSGVDSALLSRVLQDAYHLARVKIYKGFFTDAWVLLADPHPIAPELLMSDAVIEYDEDTGKIKLSVESFSIFDQHDSAVLATPESQRRRYAGDAGQDRVASLATAVFEWGGQYRKAGGGGGGRGMGAPIGGSGSSDDEDTGVRDNSSTG